MFQSVLIANRGEIACRVMRTCRRLGVRTVAIYSEADRGALHVALADDARCVGPSPAQASYLNAQAIVDAARDAGAEAIHPGYGFLAEKADLPDLCARHGIEWIGPSARCIALMGSKIDAKRVASEAGVASVPGYHGEDQTQKRLKQEAAAIGFPILIKASAGGGGKGMRRVEKAEDFDQALDLAKREALAAFGDDRVLLEKYLVRPRHLEVQIAGDRHGGLVHLFERECSIQRNYQKLIEEAPAANLAPAVRERLLDAAVRLGRAVEYDSLGTVEFVLDADDPRGADAEPYFLEMNTRLQVEHTVTEAITGLDLVEWQLNIAAGQSLPAAQAEIRQQGHAIEARLNAESPGADNRPCLGRVSLYREPHLGEAVRIDSGIASGSEITPYYDSLLAKVIAFGPDRHIAAKRLVRALENYVVIGVGTNQAFLRDVIRHPAFENSVLTTRFLPDVFPDGWTPEPLDPSWHAAATASFLTSAKPAGESLAYATWQRLPGFHPLAGTAGTRAATYEVAPLDDFGERKETAGVTVRFLSTDPVRLSIRVEDQDYQVDPIGPSGEVTLQDGPARRQFVGWLNPSSHEVELFSEGQRSIFSIMSRVNAIAGAAVAERTDGSRLGNIAASMPGLISEVLVVPGQLVKRGETVIVMEAMKLLMSLNAPADGVVGAVLCAPGQTVPGGAVLVELVAEPATAD